MHTQDWCQHLQRQLATDIVYFWKAEVGRQQDFSTNSIKFDKELNGDLMFTNKALQIMTTISHGSQNHHPTKLLENDFSLSKELERFGLTSDTPSPLFSDLNNPLCHLA